ncbi:MAG TPA: 50S ribosomal protein L18 [Spirochaetota bacterium]|nr:50S ribosomal protein L18 [Spirochaetota bacterium]HOM37930.1 50S ribosomal protein L18 [Spirochaetota bacterium]HPQ48734.1 50S ribosomal protein L18 [Spirochaetota bacterium]
MVRDKVFKREIRKLRIRNKIKGTAERPRLSIFKSNRNIFVQLIDDIKGFTLCSVSTMEKELKDCQGKPNKETAKRIAEVLAERAINKGIKKIVFDRNGYRYHGVVKELADKCREKGLEF